MNIAEVIHWGVALVPVLLLLGLFVWLDAFALMNAREIAVLLVLGGLAAVLCWPIAGKMIDTLPIGFSNYSRFGAPWIEEAIKLLAVILLFRLNRIGYKLDAVIAGFAIGAGFSVVENIIYLLRFPQYDVGTWLVRGLGTAVMHGTTLAIVAASAHEFAERATRGGAADFHFRLWWFLPGFLAAVAIHTVFNQFGAQPMVAMIGAAVLAPVVLIAILNFGTGEASEWLAEEYLQHRAQLAALDAGDWPPGHAAARIRGLCDRLDPDAAARVRDYWRTMAFLVTEAEETLIEESTGDASFDRDRLRAAFADLDRLRAAMGRSTFAALKPLLPFSRNDEWEMRELRQRL